MPDSERSKGRIFWVVGFTLVFMVTAWLLYVDTQQRIAEERDRTYRDSKAKEIMSDKLRECRSKLPPEVWQ